MAIDETPNGGNGGRICPRCGARAAPGDVFCPLCGSPPHPRPAARPPWRGALAAAVAGAVATIVVALALAWPHADTQRNSGRRRATTELGAARTTIDALRRELAQARAGGRRTAELASSRQAVLQKTDRL